METAFINSTPFTLNSTSNTLPLSSTRCIAPVHQLRHCVSTVTKRRLRPITTPVRCTASSEGNPLLDVADDEAPAENAIVEGPFTGKYGEWYLRENDVKDVLLYRSLLLISSLSILPCFILPHTALDPRPTLYDELTLLSAMSFGLSLKYIHIYARPLHKLLKVMWSVGMVGCGITFLLHRSIAGAAAVDHPYVLLTTGWILVALTGVFVKESVCFGRIHAGLLALGVPILAGGHFLGILGERGGQIESVMGTILASTYLWFAASKFRQDVKDDLGDLSVFDYLDGGNH